MDDNILTLEQTKRLIQEIVAASGPSGIEETDLKNALTAMENLILAAALWRLWSEHKMTVSWNTTDNELIWRAA